jgi:hypothetical protein
VSINFPGDPAHVNPQKNYLSKIAGMGFIIFSGLRIDIFLCLAPGGEHPGSPGREIWLKSICTNQVAYPNPNEPD